jgi:hypothetical protein
MAVRYTEEEAPAAIAAWLTFTEALRRLGRDLRMCAPTAPRPSTRTAGASWYEQLVAEVEATNWSAVGRKYGVSGNAIRKWVLAYEQQRMSVDADRAASGVAVGEVPRHCAEIATGAS